MAEIKNTTTQAAALRFLIDNAPEGTPVEIIEKAEELYTAKTKKYDRPKTVSKERRINEGLVAPMMEIITNAPSDELINATWINNNFDNIEVRSPQKARVIAEIAIEKGLLEKYTHKGRTYYKAV